MIELGGGNGERTELAPASWAGLSRRNFLALGAGGVGVAAAPKSVRWLWDAFAPEIAGATPPTFTRVLTRPTDQLRLLFEFINLTRVGDGCKQHRPIR